MAFQVIIAGKEFTTYFTLKRLFLHAVLDLPVCSWILVRHFDTCEALTVYTDAPPRLNYPQSTQQAGESIQLGS